MRTSQLPVADTTQSHHSLPLQAMSKESWGGVCYLWSRSPHGSMYRHRSRRHKDVCLLRGCVPTVLSALWFVSVLVQANWPMGRLDMRCPRDLGLSVDGTEAQACSYGVPALLVIFATDVHTRVTYYWLANLSHSLPTQSTPNPESRHAFLSRFQLLVIRALYRAGSAAGHLPDDGHSSDLYADGAKATRA